MTKIYFGRFWHSRLRFFHIFLYKLHQHTGKGNELIVHALLLITGYPTGNIELLNLQRKM